MVIHSNQTQSYGTDWEEVREEVIDRDKHCVLCGNEDANVVHHIIPRKEFDYDGTENQVENCVLVCRGGCHWDLEPLSREEQLNKIESSGVALDETLDDINGPDKEILQESSTL